MAESWYGVVAFMLIVFAVLEGWDFGAGAVHLLVARTPSERNQVVEAIGPLWVWHEVWLVGAGGVLLMAFPSVMATAFSGYYMALYLVLWCLLLRGIALEFGRHLADGMWTAFWDVVFSCSSVLLALLFGIAFGNLVRGVPLGADGRFVMSLFTDFSPYGTVGILDWYTVSVGVLTLVLLMAHGASYLALRTNTVVCQRSRGLTGWMWPSAGILLVLVTWETWTIRPDLFTMATHRPIVWGATLVVAAGAGTLVTGKRQWRDDLHFLGSALIIMGLLTGAFAALYPDMLHSTIGEQYSLTAPGQAAGHEGLVIAVVWWPISLVAAVVYGAFNIRGHLGRIGADTDATRVHGNESRGGWDS